MCLSQLCKNELHAQYSFTYQPPLLTPAQIKLKIVLIETELFLSYQERTRLMFTYVLGRYGASGVLLVPTPSGVRWQRRWTAARR